VVATKKVACDSGGGALGDPKVWYDMSEQELRRMQASRPAIRPQGGKPATPGK